MSFSQIDLCNMALARAGSSVEIQALEYADGVAVPEEARLCRRYWPLAFEATARGANWACLQVPGTLGAVTGATGLTDYPYVYHQPVDYLGWLEFPNDTKTAWRRVGRRFYLDRSETTVVYVARTNDTDLFDPTFAEALVLRLAAWLAGTPVGGQDENKAEALEAWLTRFCAPLALFVNSTETPAASLDSSDWAEARL